MCGDNVEVLNVRKKRSAGELDPQTRIKREATQQLSDLELELKSYGNNLRYECGLARRFLDEESSEHYDERVMTCAWNTTWTPLDSLDPCVWVQCLYPPQPPPESNMLLVWEVRGTRLDDYKDNVCVPRESLSTSLTVWPTCVPGMISTTRRTATWMSTT